MARTYNGGGPPEVSPLEHKFADSNDNTMWAIDYIIGPAVLGNGSAYTNRWDQVGGLTITGGNDGKNGIVIENLTEGDNDPDFAVSTVRHENMQVSPLGMTDEDGFRTQENLNSAYGLPYQKLILWDGSANDHFDNVALDEDTLELELTPSSSVAQPVTADMLGAIARIANPDEAPYVLHGFVVGVDTVNHIFYIDDANGDLHALLTATDNAMLTVFDNHDTGINEEAVHTAGTWGEESIEFSEELGGVTVFTTSSTFPAQAVGWTLQPNANRPIFFPILGVSGGSITVAGDLTGVAQAGDQYFILHPPGIDKTNGAVNTNATEQTTRYLAFGYQYITPMAGVHTGSAIEGRQAGNNLAGQYQVWNRNYLPDIGRWTTTDPAMSPWGNLLDYAHAAPTGGSDPTGLHPLVSCLAGAAVDAAITAVYNGLSGSKHDICEYVMSALIGCLKSMLTGLAGASTLNPKTWTSIELAAKNLGIQIPISVSKFLMDFKCAEPDEDEGDDSWILDTPLYVSDQARIGYALERICAPFRKTEAQKRKEEDQKRAELEAARLSEIGAFPKWFDASKEFPSPYSSDPDRSFGADKCVNRCLELKPWSVPDAIARIRCENECARFVENLN